VVDASVSDQVIDTARSAQTPDYVPQVGDVVRHKERRWTAKVAEVIANRFKLSQGSASSWYYDASWFELAQPTFTGSYAERQQQWIEHHGLKVKAVK